MLSFDIHNSIISYSEAIISYRESYHFINRMLSFHKQMAIFS